MKKIYEPIKMKIREWLAYDINEPKVPYSGNEKLFDEFRSNNDRDCVLTNGNLHADTMFSLWTPLKNAILRINSTDEIAAVGNINSKYAFLPALSKGDNLEKLLPEHMAITSKLSKLFELGLGVENVFLLPERNLNCARARRPYCDYMPVFLLESFPCGEFAYAWQNIEDYVSWVRKEKLHVFFDGEILPENVKDLSETGMAFFSKEEFDVGRTVRLHLAIRKGQELQLSAQIIRIQEFENRQDKLYGCKFIEKNNRLIGYLMHLQQERQRAKMGV